MAEKKPSKLLETERCIRRGTWELQLPEHEDWILYKLRDPAYLDQVADMFKKAHVNLVYLHVKDNQGCTYFNTKVGHKHARLGEMDYVGEMIKRLKARGIKVGCYFNNNRDKKYFFMRPEWRQLWQDGTARGLVERQNPDHDNMCFNSPYRDYIFALYHELTSNYDIDAYWHDRLDWGGNLPEKFSCHCDYCNGLFKAETGEDIPQKVDWNSPLWRKYVLWRSKMVTEYLKGIRHAIKSAKDYVQMCLNYYADLDIFGGWFHGQDPEDCLDYQDNASPEIHSEREGYAGLSIACKFCRGAGGGKPFELDVFRHWGDVDYGFKTYQQLLVECLMAFANGGGILIDDQAYSEGTLEPYTYEHRIGPVFAEIEKREEWFFDAKPVTHVAVFYSKYTRWFYGRNMDHMNRYQHSFLGACKALIESQIPFEIVTDRGINLEELSKYKVLVLPNVVCLSDDQVKVIREYVKNGGGLVATHRTSLSTQLGDSRGDYALSDVFHANYIQPIVYRLTYMKLRDGPLAEGLPVGVPLLCRDKQVAVELQKGATAAAGTIFVREGYNKVTTWCDPPLEEESRFPSIVTSEFGKGSVVYFPGRPDSVYVEWGAPEFRKLIVNAVKWAAKERAPVEVEAPMSVEVNIFEQPEKNRIVVHLNNFQTDPGKNIRTVPGREMG